MLKKYAAITKLLTALPLTPLGNIQPKTQGTPSPQKRVAPPAPSEAAEVEGSGRFPAALGKAGRYVAHAAEASAVCKFKKQRAGSIF